MLPGITRFSQSGNCGGAPCTRWGDYSAMSVDPADDCTFWYTTEYYEANGLNWQTRIGSFKFPTCNAAPTAAPATISGSVISPDGAPLAGVTINLGGARTAITITDAAGNYHFNNIDTDNFYTVSPALTNYHFEPAERSFSLVANKTDAVFTGSRDGAVVGNAIDSNEYFVRQHYVDFLGREPDEAGFNFWTKELNDCGGDAICVENKRINVSAAFYLSIEFHQTGYLVERLYKAAYGDSSQTSTLGGSHNLPVPVVRLDEFLADSQKIGQNVIVGQTGWEQQIENNKQAFVSELALRGRFTTAFPGGMSPAQFVDTLNGNAGSPLAQSERDQLVNDLTAGAKTRTQVLRAIAEHPNLVNSEFNRAFVLMQFFGYLRRNPNDSPDADYTGYDFWLTKLNQFGGNFQNAEMVKAFLTSIEYRQRFGP